MNQGVYFSANDRVYNWTLAFLRSFRKYNPDLELWLIPFNEESKKIKELSAIFNFKIYSNDSFQGLEKLGEAYELGHTTYGKYWFRRYAAFWGPLDVFVYVDARFLILEDLRLILNPIAKGEVDFFYYDLAIDQVYQPGDLRRRFLLNKTGRGFLSGIWGGRKGIFEKSEMLSLGFDSLVKRDQLNARNTDQAFINYCIDSKPHLKTAQLADYLGGYIHQGWAGQRGRVYEKEDQFYWWDYGGLEHKKKLLLLHWAGFHWNDSLPQAWLLNRFSRPSVKTIILRALNGLKRKIKSWYSLRKQMGDV